mmetsp:Transcript_28744/g.73150  ORF Transcript_28744/g.73150 Transcript_28744/m.73150 type:complete len:239 (-) Transcript_28744:143-859(-)
MMAPLGPGEPLARLAGACSMSVHPLQPSPPGPGAAAGVLLLAACGVGGCEHTLSGPAILRTSTSADAPRALACCCRADQSCMLASPSFCVSKLAWPPCTWHHWMNGQSPDCAADFMMCGTAWERKAWPAMAGCCACWCWSCCGWEDCLGSSVATTLHATRRACCGSGCVYADLVHAGLGQPRGEADGRLTCLGLEVVAPCRTHCCVLTCELELLAVSMMTLLRTTGQAAQAAARGALA